MNFKQKPKKVREQLIARKREANKIISEYFDLIYMDQTVVKEKYCIEECEICGGIGYVSYTPCEVEPCPNSYGFRKVNPDVVGLSEHELNSLSWDSLMKVNISGIDETVETIKGLFAKGGGWLTIYGDYGIGKTHLLKIAKAEAIRKHMTACYTRMGDFLDNLRAGFDSDKKEIVRLSNYKNTQFLAIDEFDKIRGTPYEKERSFNLLDTRYDRTIREEAFITIIAMNVPPTELDGYLWDRIQDNRFHIIEIRGSSLRPIMDWPEPS
jgi:hypothetical protein